MSCQPGLSEEEVQQEQRRIFSALPEFGVKDMVRWFRFVLRIRANLLRGLQVLYVFVCLFVRMICTREMLQRFHLPNLH